MVAYIFVAELWANPIPDTSVDERVNAKAGILCSITYVDKDVLAPKFGYFDGVTIKIRKDLPPRVIRFVRMHELYHCADKANDGWVKREIRANIFPGLRDPLGLIQTIVLSLNGERLHYYYTRFLNKH